MASKQKESAPDVLYIVAKDLNLQKPIVGFSSLPATENSIDEEDVVLKFIKVKTGRMVVTTEIVTED